jgi:signal transduction histidine kinase
LPTLQGIGTPTDAIQGLPSITITTTIQTDNSADAVTLSPRWASVRIADNGPGMSPDMLQQLVESFSVERRMTKETSLIRSYQIITAKHGGMFTVRSQLNVGTEFEVLLPL